MRFKVGDKVRWVSDSPMNTLGVGRVLRVRPNKEDYDIFYPDYFSGEQFPSDEYILNRGYYHTHHHSILELVEPSKKRFAGWLKEKGL